MSIIVIGAVFVDIKGYPSRTYIPGGRNAGKVRYVHGGVSRNIAEDLGNMGLDPVFLSLVDPSGSGEDVLLRLKDHGVDTRFIRKVPEGMGTWLAVFDNNNDVCASISHRPDLRPLLNLLQEEGNPLFAAAESVMIELDLDESVVEEIYRLKAKYNTRVYAAVSNINIALERRAFLQQTDCFVCNRQEAGVLFSVAGRARLPAFRTGNRRRNSFHDRHPRCGRRGLGGYPRPVRRLSRPAGPGGGYHRRRGRLLRRRRRRTDLWERSGRRLRHRRAAGLFRHLFPGKHLSPFPAQ